MGEIRAFIVDGKMIMHKILVTNSEENGRLNNLRLNGKKRRTFTLHGANTCTGFSWLILDCCFRFLWRLLWNIDSHKTSGIYWPNQWLSALLSYILSCTHHAQTSSGTNSCSSQKSIIHFHPPPKEFLELLFHSLIRRLPDVVERN